jgi:glucose dehydrogenase
MLRTLGGRFVHTLGRTLQFLGLMVPPIALVSLGGSPVYLFASLGFAVSLFLIGRLVEGYAPR